MASASALAVTTTKTSGPVVVARLRTTQLTQMQQTVSVLKRVSADVSIKFVKWGMVVYAMDTRGVCITHLEIRRDAQGDCGLYECPQEFAIGVSNNEFLLALNTGKAHDTLVLEVIRGGTPAQILRVRFTNDRGRDSFHDINILDMDDVEMKFPKYDNTQCTVVSLTSIIVHNTCKQAMATRGEFLVMYCTNTDFIMQSVGDMGKANMNIPIAAPNVKMFDPKDVVDTPFRAKVVYMFLKAYKITHDVEIRMTPNMPLTLTYEIPMLGTFRIYVTPESDKLSHAFRAQHMDMYFSRIGVAAPSSGSTAAAANHIPAAPVHRRVTSRAAREEEEEMPDLEPVAAVLAPPRDLLLIGNGPDCNGEVFDVTQKRLLGGFQVDGPVDAKSVEIEAPEDASACEALFGELDDDDDFDAVLAMDLDAARIMASVERAKARYTDVFTKPDA